jgi:hypothetical protein
MGSKSLTDQIKEGLSSMEIPKKDKKETGICCDSSYEPDPYPYGLRIDMNSDSLKSLDLKATDFEAGEEVMVIAKCKVVEIRTTATDKKDRHDSQNVQLQITSMKTVMEEESEDK